MDQEAKLKFYVVYRRHRIFIELYQYDTVELLQIEIHKQFSIPPHRQKISGWKNNPECHNTILMGCAELNVVNHLEVEDVHQRVLNSDNNAYNLERVAAVEDLEVSATGSFIRKISVRHGVDLSVTVFQTRTIKDAISEACFAPLEERKILLLYLHNGNDTFSSTFMESLKNPQLAEILQRNFFLLGWDLEETRYQSALPEALRKCDGLSSLAEVISCNTSAALCIAPIEGSMMLQCCLKGSMSCEEILSKLEYQGKFLIIERQRERDLQQLQRETGNENDMDSRNYQQLMADMLGDRDYDGFEFDQHQHLKNKIAFALVGPPKSEEGNGYDEKDWEQVERLFKIILENNNQVAQYMDRVEISFIYNCTEPLPSEKIERAKKYPDYNPNTDLMPVPIFVLRKCHGSANPCRIFIDHMGRTYQTWEEYKNRNKLHECLMVLPLNGRYETPRDGRVRLERHLSPACGIDMKILQGADYVSIAGGLVSGGIFLAATAITVAPAALLIGSITGVGVGIYSIARSVSTLYDRNRHRETLSFADTEARGAYINILAGTLGFVGAGASMAVTQLATEGVNIGRGARAVVDTLSLVNIGGSAVAVVNSSYDVFDRWYNENQRPSWLAVVQLTSSVLFFGNAVYNFRMCSTIVEEAQMRTLESYQESLRSNRHRKMFNKILKETIRQNNFNEAQGRAEVIAAIRNMHNKDDAYAVLVRSNKEMNRKGIKISASGGDITLNGVKIDFSEFATMNKKEAASYLTYVSNYEPSQYETASTRSIVSNTLSGFSLRDIEFITTVTISLLHFCSGDLKTKIIEALAQLLASLADSVQEILDEMFPNRSKYVHLMNVVIEFFAREAKNIEEQEQYGASTPNEDIRVFEGSEEQNRAARFFQQAVNVCTEGGHLTEEALKKLLTHFYNWLARQMHDYQQDAERAQRRRIHAARSPSQRVNCTGCNGYYYEPIH